MPGASTEECAAVEVVENTLVGIVGGYSIRSRLWNALREKTGWAYGLEAECPQYRGAGVMEIEVSGIIGRNLSRVQHEIIRQIARLRRYPINDKELDASRDSLIVDRARDLGGSVSMAARTLARLSLSGESLSFEDYRKTMKKVTPADARSVAKKYLAEDRLYVVTLRAA